MSTNSFVVFSPRRNYAKSPIDAKTRRNYGAIYSMRLSGGDTAPGG